MMLMSFGTDIKRDLQYLLETKLNGKMFMESLIEFIDFHAKIKQLSRNLKSNDLELLKNFFLLRFIFDFNETSDIIFTAYFLWSILTICSTLLMFENELVKYAS